MRSALRTRLTDEDLYKLGTVAWQRLCDLRAERDKQGMERKLLKYEKLVASDYEHRLCVDPLQQSIYDRSNKSLQIVRSIAKFLKARMAKDLFGSSPWFAAHPEGPSSFVLASEIQKHADWKLRQGSYKETAKKALETALDLGWVALKTTWKTVEDVSENLGNILFDPNASQPETEPDEDDENDPDNVSDFPNSSGAPVVAPDGSYIHDTDDVEETTQTDEMGQSVLGEDGEPVVSRGFAKAKHIAPPNKSNKLTWKPHLIETTQRLYYGIDVQPIYWRDVLWPINAPSVDLTHCDCITHTREMTKEELAATYDPDGDDKYVQDVLATLTYSDTSPKTYGNEPRREYKESDQVNSDVDAGTYKVTELYMRRILPGNTKPSRIVVAFLEQSQRILWCEYLAVISPNAECPIHVVAVNRVPGRAYGRGLYEIYEMPADVCDRLINSVLWRNALNADPVKFWNPHLTEEGESDPHLVIEPGKTYTAKQPQTKVSDIFATVEIPDLDDRTWTMMELFMQLIQTESGVTNANQGDMSDLPSNNTATGVNSLLESSSVLHFDVLEELRDGLTPELRYAIELIYFRQDDDETYEYLEGNASGVLTLQQAQQLAKLSMHVEILLTRAKNQELRDSALAAIPHGWNFWQAVRSDPESALHMLGLYKQVYRALQIDNPDSYFPTEAQLQQMIDQRNATMQGAPQPGPGAQAPASEAQPGEASPNAAPPSGESPEANVGTGPAGSEPLPSNVIPSAA